MKIKEKREAMGMTQKALAERVGVTPAQMCMIETGKRLPSLTVALRIASAMETTVEELMADIAAGQTA